MLTARPACLVILLACALAGCRAAPSRAPLKTTTLWRHVETWKGDASLQTESFLSETGSFRIHWTAKNDAEGKPGHLKITLHSAISGRPLVEVIDHRGDGEATTSVTEDPREFFLVVDADGTSWTLNLDEGVLAYEQPAKR